MEFNLGWNYVMRQQLLKVVEEERDLGSGAEGGSEGVE